MEQELRADKTYIMDLAMVNLYNAKGCESCNKKFNLGDRVVIAVGGWNDNCAKLIHKDEAVFDPKTKTYFDRTYFYSIKGKD